MPFAREYLCFSVGIYLKNLLLISIPPDMIASSQANIWGSRKPSKRVGTIQFYFKFSLLIYKGNYFMKKARIVLSLVALFAVAGGALAFKAMRNGQPVYTLSNAYTTFGTIYTRANATYLPAQPARFITTTGTQLTTVISTTAVVAGQTVTLQRIGGTQTITFPVFEGVQIADTYTTAVN